MPADRTAYTRVNWVNKQTKLNQGNFNQMDEGIKKNSDLAIECANYIDEIFVALIQQLAISYDQSTHVFSLRIGSATGDNATTRFNVNRAISIHTVDVELNELISNLNNGTTVVAKATADESGNNIKSSYGSSLDLTTSFDTTSGSFTLSLINKNGASLVSKTFTLEAATQSKAGLMSAQDKSRLDALFALLGSEADGDTVVNTINEVLAIFNNYPEGVNLANALASKAGKTDFESHRDNTNNPHGVTKAQVGLGNADNTSDINKPVSTAQQEQFLKAKYHLGAFDTVDTSNADYDLITRNTGYIDMGKINWSNEGFAFGGVISDMAVATSYTEGVTCSLYPFSTVVSLSNAMDNKSMLLYYDNKILFIKDTTYNDATAFKNAVQGNILQFRLATPYTEKVIKNQPLNTLDQQGSEFVRKEWEKTQNLIKENISADTYTLTLGEVNLKAGTYYLSISSPISGSFIQIGETTVAYSDYTFNQNGVFTLTNGISGTLKLRGTYNPIPTISWAMLNEGDHAYPYQPYNGAIVHEKDIENIAKTNVNNSFTAHQTFTGNDDTAISVKVPSTAYTRTNILFADAYGNQLGNIGFNASYKSEIYSMLDHAWHDIVIDSDLDPINDLLAELKTIVYDNQYPAVAEIDLQYATYYALPSQISGDKIIMSAGMDMTKVKGRSYVVNQWAKIKTLSFTNAGDSQTSVINDDDFTFVVGHKYLFAINQSVALTSAVRNSIMIAIPEIASITNYGTFTGSLDLNLGDNINLSAGYKASIFTCSTSVTGILEYWCHTPSSDVTENDINVIDLTQWFGSNDAIPADLLADPSLFTKKYWKKPLPFDTEHIEDSKPVKVIATGFNQATNVENKTSSSPYYDALKADVKWQPNTVYCISFIAPSGYAGYLNEGFLRNPTNGNEVHFAGTGARQYVLAKTSADVETSPYNTEIICKNDAGNTIVPNFQDVCINISDPLLNGKYLPYQKHEYPIIPTSHNPLRSAGSVQDDNEKVRVGTIDLGNLSWEYSSGMQQFSAYVPNKKPSAYVKDLTCAKYIQDLTSNGYNADALDKAICGYDGDNRIFLKDTSLNGDTSLITGTLNYELATPQDQSPAITLPENIEIQKGGTIEIEYDDGYSTPCDIDFEVAVSKVLEE